MWNINEDDFIHSLDDCDTEFVTPDEVYPEVMQQQTMPVTQIPSNSTKKKPKNGELTRLLQNTPGILAPIDCFPKSYVKPTPEEQPSIILDDRIPIFLGREYFRFDRDPEPNEVDDDNGENDANNGNDNIGANSINSSHNWSLGETDTNRNSSESDTNVGREMTVADYRRQFWTLFSDSEDVESPVATPVEKVKESKMVDNSVVPKEIKKRYYTPREIYMMKRGNKPEKVDDENNN
ncbi:uncharacterized protein LOC116352673 [Contarinia nasturtii]|uniref:uncharacterized protein LOC116352673 n=1 Tax=Contarinia nasturtii TaxID=265458 RepID=UPI0012D4672A|nr:uncharacterized protein LOC116352673 [Contarinia nasturtii]XP_031641280.1 uncharacterized protein LOC116352673 [Contarinia nasturtii]